MTTDCKVLSKNSVRGKSSCLFFFSITILKRLSEQLYVWGQHFGFAFQKGNMKLEAQSSTLLCPAVWPCLEMWVMVCVARIELSRELERCIRYAKTHKRRRPLSFLRPAIWMTQSSISKDKWFLSSPEPRRIDVWLCFPSRKVMLKQDPSEIAFLCPSSSFFS